jgi:hypothetical protein
MRFRVVVDVATRALSPAVNDPTTAIQVLDHLEVLLREIGSRPRSRRAILRDDDGRVRVVIPTLSWADFLTLAVTEIRLCGATSIQVVRRLRAALEDLREAVLPEHRMAIEEELGRLDATVARAFGGTEDLESAAVADRQGIGGPAGRAVDPPKDRGRPSLASGRAGARQMPPQGIRAGQPFPAPVTGPGPERPVASKRRGSSAVSS